MSKLSRALLAMGSLLLIGVLWAPIWRINLVAPQYPEGLAMEIRADRVHGHREHDLENINKLNHYIGMKRIETEDIAVLRVMPWVIGGLAAFGIGAALVGRRPVVWAWLATFGAAGVSGLIAFWWWEYDYGHHLDLEHAIIKVPGMTYQPPLIGEKQLLNFTAASWPAIGAVLTAVAFALGIVALVLDRRASRAKLALAAGLAIGCGGDPRPITYDADGCSYCRMQISDPRFGAELVTKKGKVYTFDSIECLIDFHRQANLADDVRSVWVSDYRHPGTLIPAATATYVSLGAGHSPMGRGLLAVASESDAQLVETASHRVIQRWTDLVADSSKLAGAAP